MLRLTSLSVFVFAVSLLSTTDAVALQTLRYTIVSNGKTAGSEVDSYSADGHIDSRFEFNDRGRGPKIEAYYTVASDGSPLRTDITGNDYLKAPVDEHFSIEAGVGHWKSTSEKGEAPAPGFYVSNNGPAAESALLVGALLKAKDARVKLFPAGEARLERMTEVTVESHGQKLHVTEFAITGLSFEPQTVWLDDDQHFFGSPGKWFAFLREGWEDTNDQLYALDRKGRDERYARLAHELARRPNHPVVVEHVRLFDSEQATIREDQTVVIQGERITRAGPFAAVSVPKDAEIVDGSGKTLVPGLFDMHAHAQAGDGIMNIASGVTTVRDMGNDIDELRHLQDQWENGTAIGPRVWESGFIDGHGPFEAPTGLYADTAEQAHLKQY